MKKLKFRAVFSVLASFLTLYFLQGTGNMVLSHIGVRSSTLIADLFEILVYLVSVAGAVVILKSLSRFVFKRQDEESEAAEVFAEARQVDKKSVGENITFVAVTAILCGVGVFLSLSFGGEAPKNIIFAAFAGVFLKAPLEEYLFRYLFVNTALKSGVSVAPSVVLQAVLFGIWHPSGVKIFALAAGVGFGLIASFSGKSGKVSKRGFLLCSISHGIYNAVIYAVALI